MKSFINIFLLLFLFLFIYSLLGMNLFYHSFNNLKIEFRENFDSYDNAIITVFQILTNSAWQNVLYLAMNSDVSNIISALYIISWILIGNYVFLNLFLAIMLDEFYKESQNSGKNADEDTEEILLKQKIKNLEKPAILPMNSPNFSGYCSNLEIEENAPIIKPFLVKKESKLKLICEKIIFHHYFELFMQIVVLLSCLSNVFETYFTSPFATEILIIFDHLFNFIFFLEFFIKINVYGIATKKDSYMRNSWNIMDFLILIVTSIYTVYRTLLNSDNKVRIEYYKSRDFFFF